MALFAAGSAASLALPALLLARLQGAGKPWKDEPGPRLAGGLLMIAAALGAVGDRAQRVALWCGLA